MAESTAAGSLRLVYYCSGHGECFVFCGRIALTPSIGYGHATRVSAFASHLLQLPERPLIHIISSAPKHVFADSIALGGMVRSSHKLRRFLTLSKQRFTATPISTLSLYNRWRACFVCPSRRSIVDISDSYRVDREKSRQVLKDFLDHTPTKLDEEAKWLREVGADCVLSDAAFLGWCVQHSLFENID